MKVFTQILTSSDTSAMLFFFNYFPKHTNIGQHENLVSPNVSSIRTVKTSSRWTTTAAVIRKSYLDAPSYRSSTFRSCMVKEVLGRFYRPNISLLYIAAVKLKFINVKSARLFYNLKTIKLIEHSWINLCVDSLFYTYKHKFMYIIFEVKFIKPHCKVVLI